MLSIRPHYVVIPKDKNGYAVDDQYFIGSSGLLVKPVTEKDATQATVYLPESQVSSDLMLNLPRRRLIN